MIAIFVVAWGAQGCPVATGCRGIVQGGESNRREAGRDVSLTHGLRQGCGLGSRHGGGDGGVRAACLGEHDCGQGPGA